MAKLRPAARLAAPASIGLVPGIFRFFRDREASLMGKLFVAFVVAYVVFPADLVPDVIPIFGWLDDVGMVAIALGYLAKVSARYRVLPPATGAIQPR